MRLFGSVIKANSLQSYLANRNLGEISLGLHQKICGVSNHEGLLPTPVFNCEDQMVLIRKR